MLLKNILKDSDFLDLKRKDELLDEQRRDKEEDFSGYERRDQGWRCREPNSPEWREEKAKWKKDLTSLG